MKISLHGDASRISYSLFSVFDGFPSHRTNYAELQCFPCCEFESAFIQISSCRWFSANTQIYIWFVEAEWRIYVSMIKSPFVQILACRLFGQAIIWTNADVLSSGLPQESSVNINRNNNICSGYGLSPVRPSHYLNQCWLVVNWTLRKKLQWTSIEI